jgi:hypothetical protein
MPPDGSCDRPGGCSLKMPLVQPRRCGEEPNANAGGEQRGAARVADLQPKETFVRVTEASRVDIARGMAGPKVVFAVISRVDILPLGTIALRAMLGIEPACEGSAMLNVDKRRGMQTAAPVLRLASPDYSFDPEALAVLCAAYDKTVAIVGAYHSKDLCETVAQRVIEAAGTGERDPDRLCRAALRQR